MSNDKTMQEVIAVLDRYFREAKPDDNYNISIIRGDIQRYGEILIGMGLAYIAHRLRQIGRETMLMFLGNERAGNEYIVLQGMMLMGYHHSLIKAYGEMGVEALLKVLEVTDEDTAALAAYMLASNEFIRPSSLPQLKTAFQKAYGSGYKLALALAIYRHGEKKPFKELALQFLIGRLPPFMEEIGLEMAAENVFGVIALDIASDGRAYNGPGKAHWRKKRYED